MVSSPFPPRRPPPSSDRPLSPEESGKHNSREKDAEVEEVFHKEDKEPCVSAHRVATPSPPLNPSPRVSHVILLPVLIDLLAKSIRTINNYIQKDTKRKRSIILVMKTVALQKQPTQSFLVNAFGQFAIVLGQKCNLIASRDEIY